MPKSGTASSTQYKQFLDPPVVVRLDLEFSYVMISVAGPFTKHSQVYCSKPVQD